MKGTAVAIGVVLIALSLLLLARQFLINGNQLCGRVLDVALFGSGRASGGELDQEPNTARAVACSVEAWRLTALAAVPAALGVIGFSITFHPRRPRINGALPSASHVE